ncbi:non-specific lipid transfer protein GPI-anchored 31-like [Lotus japonicus]|uniref:Bifunctional inhibitor/plant lipid transfer protein/seed storage helical domain-containing protein n=1 Tax=Lotus japonicus TaxID=34305 RepID=I3SWN7_LOTJA|nr:non-specific lipid transfer protein GPI-anchored 31-like [Lotus japonicus]AFK44679.1 unknown [Lotus japonicus]
MMTIRHLAFAMLVLASTILVLEKVPGISAQLVCKGNLTAIMTQCTSFVKKEGPKIPPSSACCETLKDVDIPCLCQHIPGPIMSHISMEKALYVGKTCGAEVPSGTKCGSYIVPPSPPHSPPVV